MERVVTKVFGAKYFNWGCFLNDAYRSDQPNTIVHWHVRPRYRNQINFAGVTFVDKAFGNQFLRNDKEVKLSENVCSEISDKLKTAYQQEVV